MGACDVGSGCRSGRLAAAIVSRRATEDFSEDAVELCIAAEARFESGSEHGATLPGAVELEEMLDAPAISELSDRKAGLLVKKTTQAGGTEPCAARELLERETFVAFADETRSALDGRMEVAHGNIRRALERLPRSQQSISEACVHDSGLVSGCNLGEQRIEPLQFVLREPAAGFAAELSSQQRPGRRVSCNAPYGAPAKDGDPHAEVRRLFDEHVILRGEEPEQVTSTDLVAAVAQEIDAQAAGDEVQFEFVVRVAPIGGSDMIVLPHAALQIGRQVEALAHDDKKR